MFKKVATLQFKKVYVSDNNGKYYWRDFVKQANSQPMTDANFVPKNFYEYDTKNFLYITARAISGMEKWGCNGNFDAFPWKELKSAYPTFCGKGFYIEHKEDDETDAKGIILDAQPDDDNEFINCICAISKEEYPDICEQILNGQLNQVSMSCLAAECECSKCHNVATREEELCEHMNPKHPNFCKGSLDGDKPIYEINKNIVFTGLSGVAVPADKDAFIFDVKASKKQNSKTINKEYNKYCRAKKEYEYINSLLEKEDTRKYIESQLKKAFQDIKGESWDEVLDNIQKAGYDFDEHYYDEPYHFIKALKDKKEYEIELFGYHNGSYEVIGISDTGRTYKDLGDFLVNSSLNKKADVEYISDTIKEIPPIDFYIEFMNAGKSKGVNTDINKDQLEIGIKVEMEHTTNPVIAEKIAMDHIKEIPNYYTLLAEMEAKAKFEFEQAKDIINKETNEEYSTKLGSKQFFKIKKANNDLSWWKSTLNDTPPYILLKDVKKGDYYFNKEIYNIAINILINKIPKAVLKEKIITKEDKELFNKAIEKVFESSLASFNISDLLINKIITKEDGELFNKAIEKVFENGSPTYDLIKNKIITKQDGELYNKAINILVKKPEEAFHLLKNKLITQADGELFNEAVKTAIKYNSNYYNVPYSLIKNKIITKQDGELYNKIINMVNDEDLNYFIDEFIITKEDVEKAKQFNKQSSKQFFKIKKANNSKIRIGDHVKINYKLGDWELNNVLGKVLDVRTNNNGDNYYIVKIFDTNTTYTFHDQDLTLIRSKLSSKKWFKIANNIDNYGLSELQRKELQNIIDHIDIVNEDEVVTWDELIESVNQDILDYDFMNKNKVNIIDYIEKELGQEIEVY